MLNYETKVKSFKQTKQNTAQCQKLQVFEVLCSGLDTSPQSFCDSFIAISTLRCLKSANTSTVSSASSLCCYGNHAAGSKPI